MKTLAFNPYLPSWEYVPDGEPRVFGDRLYVYGSHDAFNGPDFCVNDYVGWSAPLDDLGDWRCEGVIYRAAQDPRNKNGRMHMCAPDCVQHPDGTPWGEKKGDTIAFDPGVLVDDDGRVYCYVGFAPQGFFKTLMKLRGNRVEESVCLELEPDMKTVRGCEKPIVPGPALAKGTDYEGHAFFEASSIRKIGGMYYYVYSSELSHELCYAVSDRPDGDFRYGGTLVSIGDLGYKGNTVPTNYTGNTHGGMVELNGDWYAFYHRQTNKQKCARQGCAEKLMILPDGSIPQVEGTSCGLNDSPLPGKGRYEARIACNLSSRDGTFSCTKSHEKDKKGIHPYFTQSGGDREHSPEQYIANLTDGAWCGFKYFSFDGSEKTISVTVRSTAACTLSVSADKGGIPIATVQILPSAEWKAFSASMTITKRVAPLFFTCYGLTHLDFTTFEIR